MVDTGMKAEDGGSIKVQCGRTYFRIVRLVRVARCPICKAREDLEMEAYAKSCEDDVNDDWCNGKLNP